MNRLYFLPLVLFSLVFLSCVYFNTFYNAEISFKKALKIIEESPIIEDDKLPNQASKLLGEAIENSKLVIKEYPDSKYIDDAMFIIAKSSFLRNEVAIAENYFNLIIGDYPESKYYSLSEIWLAYTHFRMGMVDSAIITLEIILDNMPKKKELYIIHNALAEIAMEVNNMEKVYRHYELAAENTPSDSKKTSTYGKLVKIADKNQDKERASIYLEKLEHVAPDNIRIDSKMQWIIYQRELGKFDKIINEIESMLGLSEFEREYLKLELELGKVYLDKGDHSIAKDIFVQLVENYSKKNETAEAYYHLGYMALREDFNLDLAKEYFEKSKDEKSRSQYGKKSGELLNKITRFESLQSLYKDVVKKSDSKMEIDKVENEHENSYIEIDNSILNNEVIDDRNYEIEGENFSPEDRFRSSSGQMEFNFNYMVDDEDILNHNDEGIEVTSSSPDSILFMIGEMLLYDFNHLKLSLDKFKSLAEEYPQSEFAPQALYVLSHFEPDANWQIRLEADFPNSSFLQSDSTRSSTPTLTLIESQRDYAWLLAQNSYKDSYEEFNRLFLEKHDTISAYISGFISDIYLNDIEKTVTHYQVFLDNFPNHNYSPIAEQRLKEIKQDLKDLRDVSLQGIDYQKAVIFLQREFDYDSVKVLLSKISAGISSSYKNAANSLKATIRDYEELSAELFEQNVHLIEDSAQFDMVMPTSPVNMQQDSIMFQLAILFAHQLAFVDSAKFYHNKLIESFSSSKFRPHSLLYLSEIDPGGDWAMILSSDYPDTSFIPDSIIYRSIYSLDIFQDDFKMRMEEKINNYELYLELFPEPVDSSLLFPDSTGINLDSLFLFSDSTEIQIDLFNPSSDSLTITIDNSHLSKDSITIDSSLLNQTLHGERRKFTP